MFKCSDGLVTSLSTLSWFMISFFAASSRALCECVEARPSASEPNGPHLVSASLWRAAQIGAHSRFVAATHATPTSFITARIAAAAKGDMSGVRPGFSSGFDWMRPSR